MEALARLKLHGCGPDNSVFKTVGARVTRNRGMLF